MTRVFSLLCDDPVSASWKAIVGTLSNVTQSLAFRIPYRLNDGRVEGVMTLGTAQLGLEYGINNRIGQPSEADAVEIVRQAIDHGVSWVDTARLYGDSERRIGLALKGSRGSRAEVMTKLPGLPDQDCNCSRLMMRHWIDAQVFQSLHALGVRRLGILMLHRWEDRAVHAGVVWDRLLEHRGNGIIKELGASLYDPDHTINALSDADVRHVQIPFNLLDRRWLESEVQERIRSRGEVRVHVRSIFLQGLLLSDGDQWPRCDLGGSSRLRVLDGLVEELDRSSRADLCIAYVRGHTWVSSIVLGVETLEQLHTNLNLVLKCRPLTADEIAFVHDQLPGAPECVVNPSKWST